MSVIIYTLSDLPKLSTHLNPITGKIQDNCHEIADESGEIIAIAFPVGEPIKLETNAESIHPESKP